MTSQDFEKRIDLTGLDSVTGSELNQLVDTATVADDKGLRIITDDTGDGIPDVPDPDQELEGVSCAHWKRYQWVRNPWPDNDEDRVRTYNWNEKLDSHPTFLKWQEEADPDQIADSVAEVSAIAENANTNATAAVTAAINALNNAATAQATATNAATVAAEALSKANDATESITSLDDRVSTLEDASDNGAGSTNILSVSKGGTGAGTVAQAKANFGLSHVPIQTWILRELQAAGTNGGTFTAGIQTKRTLNDISSAVAGFLDGYVSLEGDSTFALLAGDWLVELEAPAFYVGAHKVTLYDVTNGAIVGYGTSEFTNNPSQAVTRSKLTMALHLAVRTTYQVNHTCGTTQAVNGLGVAANLLAIPEIYTVVKLTYLGNP